jgi:hypothetical protein
VHGAAVMVFTASNWCVFFCYWSVDLIFGFFFLLCFGCAFNDHTGTLLFTSLDLKKLRAIALVLAFLSVSFCRPFLLSRKQRVCVDNYPF